MRARHVVPLALAASLVLAACGGGDDGGATADTSSPAATTAAATTTAAETTAPADTTAAAGNEDDQAIADSLVLTQEDVGAEWTATPADPSQDDGDNPLARCGAGTDAFDADPTAEAESPDFSLGETQISSSATVHADARTIEDQLAVFTDAATPGCITDLFEEQLALTLPAGVEIEGFGFEALDFPPVEGTGYAFEGGGTIVAEGVEQPFAIVILGDSSGRAGATVLFQFLGEADRDLVETVWSAMEEKLAAVDA